jgi:hypothetical protein
MDKPLANEPVSAPLRELVAGLREAIESGERLHRLPQEHRGTAASRERAVWQLCLSAVGKACQAGGATPLDLLPLDSLMAKLSDIDLRGVVSPSFKPDPKKCVNGGLSNHLRRARGHVASAVWCLREAGYSTRAAAEHIAASYPQLERITRTGNIKSQLAADRITDVFEQVSKAYATSPCPQSDRDHDVLVYSMDLERIRTRVAGRFDEDLKRQLDQEANARLDLAQKIVLSEVD